VREGFEVRGVLTKGQDPEAVEAEAPDLLIIDVAFPDLSGLQVLRQLRNRDALKRLPVLLLTGSCQEDVRLSALEIGADDFLTKPFSLRELLARSRALLRRAEATQRSPHLLQFGQLVIDRDLYRVSLSGRLIPVSVLEFRLLCHLALHPNNVFTRNELLGAVWGSGRFVNTRSVDACVRRLREKVERNPGDPRLLRTVHGAGYVFEPGSR